MLNTECTGKKLRYVWLLSTVCCHCAKSQWNKSLVILVRTLRTRETKSSLL